MKVVSFFLLTGILFLTTACPGVRPKSNQKKLEENNMNFPELEPFYFEGITFDKSEIFSPEYNDNYVLSDNYSTFIAYDIYLHLSVELFNASKIDVIQFSQDEGKSDLEALHSHYVQRRISSLYKSSASIQKKIPKSTGQKGYIQVIHGNANEYENSTTYFIATVEANDEYFVFQLIGKRGNMGYLYDDFLALLSSIH